MTVAAILETARTIMRAEGVAALSMQELARRLGMRAPSLYHYFSGKMELYDALFRQGFVLYGEQVQRATQLARTWQDDIRLAFEAYMAFAVENPELYQLCFERPVPGFVPSAASLRVSLDILEAAYERAARWRMDLDSGLTPRATVDLVIALMHGLTALHLANDPQTPAGQGRFGSLVPAALALINQAWQKPAPLATERINP